jgi:hypothetical protein
MKKHFFPTLIIFFCLYLTSNAQDVIKTNKGEAFKTRLLKLTRKKATYKIYDDPEFNTHTLRYKELGSIQKEGQREVLFNHKLPRAFICYSMGIPDFARALGSFGSTSFTGKAEPGFATHNKGFNAKFDIGFYIYRKLGLSIGLGYTSYSFNYAGYADALNGGNFGNNNPNLFSVQSQEPGQYNYNNGHIPTNDDTWTFFQAFIGPIYSIKLAKRITWDFKARGGIVNTNKPNVVIEYPYVQGGSNNGSTYSEFERASVTSFGYNLGTSMRFALSRRLAFYIAADYVHTAPSITYQTQDFTSSYNNSTNSVDLTYTSSGTNRTLYKISSLNLSAGFALQFNRKGNKYE